MSILFENHSGTLLSVEAYLNSFLNRNKSIRINGNLFKIYSPYKNLSAVKKKKKTKSLNGEPENIDLRYQEFEKEILEIQNTYSQLLLELRNQQLLTEPLEHHTKNKIALDTADSVYNESGRYLIDDVVGSNIGPLVIKTLQHSKFIIPENCKFLSKNVNEIDKYLSKEQFDLILLDPPWWNKYIRRKKKKSPHDAYKMMYNCDLKEIPVDKLLSNNGIVVVWCTNSFQHLNTLLEDIFPKWKVSFVAKWYWLKITVHGEPICEFSKPPGKQPFEQIIIGCRDLKANNLPRNGKILLSVPSAIHSHKPPLDQVLKAFLPENPRCLEIFARYLLPNWTSYGNEVLRLQHESMYIFNE
ncbi:unnamed protein product [Ceutorhynchus assimilis]|uniref:Methyltransferase-like protein 4 n=1 Tax=Ceutorhynchus assimilis TaxID=467358 RepID=A0A9N9MT16_9CUCU|nr:unnamed protein product [Ceutorhynchus assimilis]